MRQWVINGRRVNGLIRRVQRGTMTVNGVTSTTATILAVDLANARLVFEGMSAGAASTSAKNAVRVELTNATTVTAYVNAVEAAAHTVAFSVYEYWPGVIRSVQRGTGNATLTTPVAPTASMDWLGFTNPDVTGAVTSMMAQAVLTPPTTVAVVSVGGGSDVGWQVVDWN